MRTTEFEQPHRQVESISRITDPYTFAMRGSHYAVTGRNLQVKYLCGVLEATLEIEPVQPAIIADIYAKVSTCIYNLRVQRIDHQVARTAVVVVPAGVIECLEKSDGAGLHRCGA